MTASEFAFLALGLVLGTTAGAAIIVVLGARSPRAREVRVTMTPLAVPTRSGTLAGDPYDPGSAGPAPRGPGDRRSVDREPRAIAIDDLDAGAPVLRPAFVPVAAAAGGPAFGPSFEPSSRTGVRVDRPAWQLAPEATVAAIPGTQLALASGSAPAPDSLAVSRPGTGAVVAVAEPVAADVPDPPVASVAEPTTVTVADQPAAGVAAGLGAPDADAAIPRSEPGIRIPDDALGVAVADAPGIRIVAASPRRAASADAAPSAGSPEPASGPCAELRTIAEERCAVASRAREAAGTALSSLRDAQRSYDDETRRAEEADSVADARAVRAAKEAAQHAFRAARERAGSRDELEDAARTWLATINRINLDARDAAARAARARTAANALVTTIERLTAEADGARIASEVAQEACVAARQALAECDEAETLAAAAAIAPAPLASIEPATHFPEDEPELTAIQAGEREARIMRLLRGDREALLRTVAELAGDDPAGRRRWQMAITGLVDAITAQAIDASIVDVPDQPPFWGPFTAAQRREVVAALASLGYRFDGLGGFADGRVPSQRDLSLALGYAGLDPMRVRRWPTEAEARELLAEARVAADEYLAGAAGGFTLSELVDLLGRRADGLTDLWNDWGRVRGRLLAVD